MHWQVGFGGSLLLWLSSFYGYCQTPGRDTTSVVNPYLKVFQLDESKPLSPKMRPDTSLADFHRYNPLNANLEYALIAGAAGQPAYSLKLADLAKHLHPPIYLGNTGYQLYRQSALQFRTFEPRVPYTRARATLGAVSAQFIELDHAQVIRQKHSLGLTFQRAGTGALQTSAEQLFERQQSRHFDYGLYYRLLGDSSLWKAEGKLIHHQSIVQRGGGTSDLELARSNDAFRYTAAPRLFNADDRASQGAASVLVGYALSSAIGENRTFVQLAVSQSWEKYVYRDPLPDSLVYGLIVDSGPTYDSSRVIINEAWLALSGRYSSFTFALGPTFADGRLIVAGGSSSSFTYTGVKLEAKQANRVAINASTQLLSEGRLAYNGTLALSTQTDSSVFFATGLVKLSQRPASLLTSDYAGNHFVSLGERPLQTLQYGEVAVYFKQKLNLQLTGRGIRQQGLPVLQNGVFINRSMSALQLEAKASQTYLKSISAQLLLRYTPQTEQLEASYPLPAWYLGAGAGIQRRFFGVIDVKLGADLRYFSTFNAPSYAPGSVGFSLQDSVMTGGVGFGDVYISAFLKKARFFVMMENVGEGWLHQGLMPISPFPLVGRALRFGIEWRFFN